MAIRARWKGNQHPHPARADEPAGFIEGVPAHDLSDDEYAALSPELKTAVRSSDLYDVAPATKGSD